MIKLGLLSLFNEQQIWHKVQPILRDPEHALYGEFQHLPHGHQFRSLAHKTNGRGNSLFSPLQFHSSRHNQPSELSVVTILYCFYQGCCPVKFEYDSSGVLCMWLGWSTGVRGGGLEGYVFCCDNLHYGFPLLFLKSSLSGFIIALNAFDVCFFSVFF